MAEEPLNASYFIEGSAEYRAAKAQAMAGIGGRLLGLLAPREVVLKTGELIFRFGHSLDRNTNEAVPPWTNATSPWWIRQGDFLTFLPDEGRDFYSGGMNNLARVRLAILPEYGQVDRLIAARLRRPLLAFEGPGKVQIEKDGQRMVRWVGDSSIKQIFIPGLRNDRGSYSDTHTRSLIILRDASAHEFFLLKDFIGTR
jgi:hypothetical protein